MKKCSKCKEDKELEMFSRLKSSSDGLNYKCRQCSSLDFKNYYRSRPEKAKARNQGRDKEKQKACSAAYHHRRKDDLEYREKAKQRAKAHYWANKPEGSKTRAEYYADRAAKAKGRRVVSLTYAHKRRVQLRAREAKMSELDIFVFEEAVSLCKAREEATGVKWHVDHIIPLNHKKASGLHCAANFQVVPASWNFRKSNTSFQEYDFT